MDEKVYLTEEGLEKIKKELDTLKNQTRPNVVERLSLARLQGDLSENSEYSAAKEQLAFIDGQIEELEEVIKNARVVKGSKKTSDLVSLGCKVTVEVNKKKQLYQIVGEWEADPVQKKVSHSSPLGKALIGRKVGDEVEFEAPAGKVVFKIVKIE